MLSSSTPDVAKDESLPSPDKNVRGASSIVGGRPLVESVSSTFPAPPLFDINDAVKTSDTMKALNGEDSLTLPLVADAVPPFNSGKSLPISSTVHPLSATSPAPSDDPLAELASNSFLYSQQAESLNTPNTLLAVGSNLKGSSSLLGTKVVGSTGISLSSGLWNNDNDLRLFSSSNAKPAVNDGFNIEHFLDGILNENNMNEEEDEDAVVATAIATVADSSPVSWAHGNNATNQSDSARQESRAFAYGINVTSIPENKDSDDFYERDDFFENNYASTTIDDDSK